MLRRVPPFYCCAECCYTECRYAECHYVVCRGAFKTGIGKKEKIEKMQPSNNYRIVKFINFGHFIKLFLPSNRSVPKQARVFATIELFRSNLLLLSKA
jgi:hypothetical protein